MGHRSHHTRNLTEPDTEYGGYPINAAGNVHRVVAQRLLEVAPPPTDVLDIAAGYGALSARLADLGYSVTANDLRSAEFRVPDIECLGIDLDSQDFATRFGRRFHVVLAVEVIEHLESPPAFLRNCARLLDPGGVLIVTTPNLESAVSRIMFMTRGHLPWFTPAWTRDGGHISPQLPWVLRMHAEHAHLAVVGESSTDPALVDLKRVSGRGMRRLLYSRPMRNLVEMLGHARGGDVTVYEMRPTAGA